ncbi:MAG: hypothetical protein KatS3mg095_0493 [Candidatus Parcubacteria bacterium]|nr:MAG: hypothetical protein KatS3mg095_0493 [Candidatus Parcubacteria bacterium]
MGNSYGGYLSLKTIYEYPSKINGAISINGVTDWWTLINNNKNSIFKIHFNGYPTKNNLELYNQASIFLKKENLKNKKVLLIYGKKDRTVPISQNSLFTNAYNKIAKIEDLELDEAHV